MEAKDQNQKPVEQTAQKAGRFYGWACSEAEQAIPEKFATVRS